MIVAMDNTTFDTQEKNTAIYYSNTTAICITVPHEYTPYWIGLFHMSDFVVKKTGHQPRAGHSIQR